ncbi:SAM-dependent methyltransferase [Actinomadura rifamycini]|uniref:SAM-dependent methyltransferase n=1 Tax=Actinomadura rifamycini TaxID=31962 RepID=UPI00041B2A29|nr:SAM-dependent methyltransferase [Actinomadura rifamycini]
MTDEASPVNTEIPQTARIWNYWLGGKDNYEPDVRAGNLAARLVPHLRDTVLHSRAFLHRTVRHLTDNEGIQQFLDVGAGLPVVDRTHEVAQAAAPGARVVYVDNDPLVLAHARALLTSAPEGKTAYLPADLRKPEDVIAGAAETLDFDEPIALLLMGILGHMTDYDEGRSIVRRLVDALPSGSYLALYDATNVVDPATAEAIDIWNRSAEPPYVLRTPDQLAGFFEGMELLPPGVVSCPLWHPRPADIGTVEEIDEFCGVARKP